RDRRRRLSPRRERAPARVHGQVRDGAARRDPRGHGARGRAPWMVRPRGLARSGLLRGHDRRVGRSAEGRERAREGEVRDEGWRDLQERDRSEEVSAAAALSAPETTEYAPYYGRYISLVPAGDVREELERQRVQIGGILAAIPESKADHRYASDK